MGAKERLDALDIVKEVEAMLPPPRRREYLHGPWKPNIRNLLPTLDLIGSERRGEFQRTFEDRPGRISSEEAASFVGVHGLRAEQKHEATRNKDDHISFGGAQSEYYSVSSFACRSKSMGVQSQYGATWKHAMALTANSGFASGTPRADGWKGVREGREQELGLPLIKRFEGRGKDLLRCRRLLWRRLGELGQGKQPRS